MESFDVVVNSPVGPLGLCLNQGVLQQVHFIDPSFSVHSRQVSTPWVERINHYFKHPFDAAWDLPFMLQGSEYQMKVWKALAHIPCGEVRTYGQLAQTVGGSARAIGGACKRNPCPIVIPCHRVVAQNHLGGFAGQASGEKCSIKAWLLKHEGLILN